METFMRTLIAALLAGLMSWPSVVFAAEPKPSSPSGVIDREKTLDQRAVELATMREVIAVASRDALRQTAAQQTPVETKPWMERHPVWFGLIVGASVGAAWGAASCSDGCFPIGAGGAAMVGSWWGAGAGTLIGWGVGRAK